MSSKYQRWLLTARGFLTIGAVIALLIVYVWRHFFGG
jgi:hypothetical protein